MDRIKNSPQWHNGKFQNPIKRQDASFFKILNQFLWQKSDHAVPQKAIPFKKLKKADFDILPLSGLRITWLGHSTVLIEIDGYRILTDPVWSRRASPVSFAGPKRFFDLPLELKDLPSIDAVVISHNHYDHLDEKTIKAIKDKVPLFIVPLGVGRHLEGWDVEPYKIIELDWWQAKKIKSLSITATPARHFSGRSAATMFSNDTLWAGFAIATTKHKVYFSGDTAMFPEFEEIGKRLGPFDIAMIETGAYNHLWSDVHIGPEQAVVANSMAKGRLLMPIHWGTFDLSMHTWTEPAERIIKAAEAKKIRLVIPKPGEAFEPAKPPELKRWWPQLPHNDAQKDPIVSSGL